MLFDHYSSVVYRYQGEPHCPQPNLPTFAECRPRYPEQMSCDESWKVGSGKKRMVAACSHSRGSL